MSDSDHKILKQILVNIIIILFVVLSALLLWWSYLKLLFLKLLTTALFYTIGLIIFGILSFLLWILIRKAVKNRFQYSLRMLMMVFTIIALVLGLLVNPIKQAYHHAQQRQAAERALSVLRGGTISFRDADKAIKDGKIAAPEEIVTLGMAGSNCNDSDLELISGLCNLVVLDLENTQVTDKGLMHLIKMTNLRLICLAGTKVTEDGIKSLQIALPKCEIDMQTAAQRRAKALLKHNLQIDK